MPRTDVAGQARPSRGIKCSRGVDGGEGGGGGDGGGGECV
jgi:hypothetical protein